MRADAEIDEGLAVLDRVDRDVRLAGGLLLDQLDLERLTALGEEVDRLLARPQLTLVGQVLRRQRLHLLLDGLEILGHERARDDEVVEEAVVGRRSNAALGPGIQVGDGCRQQVRGAVAVDVQRLRAPVRQQFDARVLAEGERQIDWPAVHHGRDRRLGQARRDRGRDVGRRAAGGHATAEPSGSVIEISLMNLDGLPHVRRSQFAVRWKPSGQSACQPKPAMPMAPRGRRLVGASGVEPPTSCVSSRRSNH